MDILINIGIALLGIAIPLMAYLLMRTPTKTTKEKVIVAEAGKLSEMQADYVPFVYMNPIQLRAADNTILDTTNLIRVLVHGCCMVPVGIMDGNQLFVEKINKNKAFSLQVKHDDIMLIYIKDKNVYKLRVFDKFGNDENLVTFRYNQETGEIQYSSRPHTRESVIGIVRYKYAK